MRKNIKIPFFLLLISSFLSWVNNAQATPSVPQDLTGRYIGRTLVYLSWSPSNDVDHGGVQYYRVYRDSVYHGGPISQNYIDDSVVHPADYVYTVSAVDLQGYESAQSTPFTVLGDTQAPTVPQGVTAFSTSSSAVSLYWQASTDNLAVAYYVLRRDGEVFATLDSTHLSFYDYYLTPEATYSYTVSARDEQENESVPSAPSVVTMPANVPPDIFYIGNQSVNEGSLLTFDVTTVDSDGDIDTLTASNLPPGADFQITDQFMDWAIGTFSWTPDYSQAGTYNNIVFTSTDNWGGVTTETISILVNNGADPGDTTPPDHPTGLAVI